jgi:hypothetical protein
LHKFGHLFHRLGTQTNSRLVPRIGLYPGYVEGFVLVLRVARCCSNSWLCTLGRRLSGLEIIVLRHELGILRRTTRRPAITAVDRVLLAVVSRLLRARVGDPSS